MTAGRHRLHPDRAAQMSALMAAIMAAATGNTHRRGEDPQTPDGSAPAKGADQDPAGR
jgi:hypothetical protein